MLLWYFDIWGRYDMYFCIPTYVFDSEGGQGN